MRWIINVLVAVATIALAVGISAPLLTLKKFIYAKNTFSLWSGIEGLWSADQVLLAIIICLFSIVLPIVKLLLLAVVVNIRTDPRLTRALGWLRAIGKWSMLDVFVVAVLFASVKLGALADTQVHYGVMAFGIAVIVTMVATELTRRWMQNQGAS